MAFKFEFGPARAEGEFCQEIDAALSAWRKDERPDRDTVRLVDAAARAAKDIVYSNALNTNVASAVVSGTANKITVTVTNGEEKASPMPEARDETAFRSPVRA